MWNIVFHDLHGPFGLLLYFTSDFVLPSYQALYALIHLLELLVENSKQNKERKQA